MLLDWTDVGLMELCSWENYRVSALAFHLTLWSQQTGKDFWEYCEVTHVGLPVRKGDCQEFIYASLVGIKLINLYSW